MSIIYNIGSIQNYTHVTHQNRVAVYYNITRCPTHKVTLCCLPPGALQKETTALPRVNLLVVATEVDATVPELTLEGCRFIAVESHLVTELCLPGEECLELPHQS